MSANRVESEVQGCRYEVSRGMKRLAGSNQVKVEYQGHVVKVIQG